MRTSERGEKLFRIATALFQYETDFGDYPPTLFSLLEKRILTEGDLLLKNADGSLSIPDYYPGRKVSGPPDAVMLKVPSERRDYSIVVKVDLSMWAFANEKDAEQAGTEQPATRSESDSEDSDKPQPEAEGRSR